MAPELSSPHTVRGSRVKNQRTINGHLVTVTALTSVSIDCECVVFVTGDSHTGRARRRDEKDERIESDNKRLHWQEERGEKRERRRDRL